MKDFFVSYNQAKGLKEIGYEEYSWFGSECSLYKPNGDHTFYMNGIGDGTYISAPLKSQVLKWFRDEFQVYGEVLTDQTTEPKFLYIHPQFIGNPNDLTEKEWEWKGGLYSVLYRSYEQAESELIDSLIQFVKFEKGML